MGTDVVPTTVENLRILTLLSARENLIGDGVRVCVCVCVCVCAARYGLSL